MWGLRTRMRGMVRGLIPASAALFVAACRPGAQDVASVAARLPKEVAGLRAVGADETFEPATIYSYLDGGAEVYLAFGLRACLARHYRGVAGELILDLFEMRSSADAFGVFSRDGDGEPIAVGQGARLRPGWLSAWKGRFFVSITADRDDEPAQRALVELGRAVSAAIREEGPPPALLRELPQGGLDREGVAYAHDHVTLAARVALPEGNPIGLDAASEVALGAYRRGEARATLLLVRLSDAAAAEGGARRLAAAWGATAGEPSLDEAGRVRLVARRGSAVAVALAATDEAVARELVDEALAGTHGT